MGRDEQEGWAPEKLWKEKIEQREGWIALNKTMKL